ncbi:unnamed protein product [Closterium sp. NIES-64]|nr:unnamed protein product [Closterium sp. NIES-64]
MRDLCGKAGKMGLGGGFWRAVWWQAQISPSPRGRRSSAHLAERSSAGSADFLRYLRPRGTCKSLSESEDAVDDALCLTVRRYTNGDRYEGETRDGVASGSGVYYFDEAAGKYEGEWADGKYSGLGVESWESGSVYRGEYKRGYREGRGLYQFHTGDAYAGAWARGQSHGAGLQMCADGSTYAGQFSYGLKHGFGIYTFRNGDVYAGEYFRDAMHGYGVYTFSNGQCYEGAWHDGCKQGLGRYSFRSGDSLMGHWHLGALLTRCCRRQIQSVPIKLSAMKLTDGMAALVTGAGSGIGRAASLYLASKGLRVTIVDFSEAGGLETVLLIGEQTGRQDAARFVQCDVSKPSDLARAFAVHMQWCGRLDVCLNNAGIGEKEWFLKDTSADGKGSWRHVLDVDLTAVVDGTRLAVHAMQLSGKGSKGGKRGVIVNVASAAGLYPSPNGPIYAASKAGVVMFTRSLAHLAGSGIRINALCPEFIQTPLVTQVTGQAAKHLPKVVASVGGFIPMDTIVDGLAELIEDEKRAGECMWITNRLGKQWWPTEEEKRRYLVAGTPGGGDSKGGDSKGSDRKSDSSGGGGALALGAMPSARRGAGLGAAGGEASGKLLVGVASGLPSTFRKLQAISIIEAPLPLPVPAGKVLLRVRYAGINASDVNYSAGRYAGSQAEASQQLPFDAGFEAVGEIVALTGSTTTGSMEKRSKGGLAVGQAAAALAYGAFAEYMLVDARWVIPVPDCSPQMVALLTSGLTASIALSESGRMGSGETVLVTAAAGGTGQFAVQLAKLAGNRVVATCGSESKAAVLRDLGVDVVVNHRTEKDMAKALKQACGPQGAAVVLDYALKQACGPQGAAVVFESVGGDMFAAALKALGRFGRLIVIGMMSQYTAGQEGQWVSKAYPGLCERLLSNSQTLVGFFLLHYPQLWRSHLTKLVTLYQAGLLKVALDPTPFKGLPAVPSAVEHLQAGSSVGKVGGN